jgi:hypothetical protein
MHRVEAQGEWKRREGVRKGTLVDQLDDILNPRFILSP